MTLQEKSELVRLLNLYQADLLNQNRKNIENGRTEYFVPGVNTPELSARNSLSNSARVLSHGGRYNYGNGLQMWW